MKKLLLLGIFGFVLGLGFTAPSLAGAQMTGDAEAALAFAQSRLSELQQQVILVADTESAPALSASDRALLLQALSQLSAVLVTVDQQLASNQIPAEKQPVIRATVSQMRTTLTTMGATIASMSGGSNVAMPEPSAPIAQAPRPPAAPTAPAAPQVTLEVPEEIAQAPVSETIPAPVAPRPDMTANIGDTARRWGTSWNFWLAILLLAIAAVAGVLLRRRTDEPDAAFVTPPPSAPSNPEPPKNPNQS